jgi:nitrate/nitrite transport system substrate-binding protein
VKRQFGFRLSLLLAATLVLGSGALARASGPPEKTQLTLGFIKLTDCAPLVIAKELGFFEAEQLDVALEAQANWKILLDRVVSGELDAAHMLAGQPIGAALGLGAQAKLVTGISLDLNGNACTLAPELWKAMQLADPKLAAKSPAHPVSAAALKAAADAASARGAPLRMGMVFPVSSHNYELRYWLAAGGIRPGFYTNGDVNGMQDADVLIAVTPPPQMPATLEQGTIQGYCVGEPWNQQAVIKGIGVPVVTNFEIRRNQGEKVFGVTAAWADANPETHVRLVKALIRAGQWLDQSLEHRKQAVEILARREYVGADAAVIANSMTGTFEFERGDRRALPDFNVFFRYHATYPYYSDGVWFLTQMRRWGQIPSAKPDSWYDATIRSIYRPDVWRQAAERLVKEGKLPASEIPETDGYRPPSDAFADGVSYDGKQPTAYLRSFAIGLKD